MPRTQDEILNRILEVQDKDVLGFQRVDLIVYLDFDHAKQFLKEDAKKEEWKQEVRSPKEKMIDYMPFAWEKANNCRGISAARSISHYQAWLWLDGNEELAEKIEDYEFYGKPQLVMICEYLGLDHSRWDDGIRTNR